MRIQRRENGFNLAFLDVMACGLGAVLLILIIVTFTDDTPIPNDEIERLQQELAATQSDVQDISELIAKQQQRTAQAQSEASGDASRIANLNITQQALQQAIARKQALIAELEDAVAALAPKTADDPIALPNVKEETYLLGLVMEGRNIGILIDSSASMSDDKLLAIIKRKISTDEAYKQAGAKWQRTKRIAKWMLARLPENANVAVVTYNEKAKTLGLQGVQSAKVSKNRDKLVQDINMLVPQHGTNLQAGLQQISSAMPNMTDLYIITDGLPSLLNAGSGFPRTGGCEPYKGRQSTITGQCRALVFNHALRVSKLSGVKTSIVLLPLEGDPQAAALYWQWANYTGGTFISPAGSWP